MFKELTGIDQNTVKIGKDTQFSRDGFPILNPPAGRLILPEEIDRLEQKLLYRVRLFDMGKPEDVADYQQVMSLHMDGKYQLKVRMPLEPNADCPNIRVHLEWCEIWAYFRERTPNSKFLENR